MNKKLARLRRARKTRAKIADMQAVSCAFIALTIIFMLKLLVKKVC